MSTDPHLPMKASVRDSFIAISALNGKGLDGRSTACGRGNAVAQQATPAALLANFQQVLAAGESTLRTDVPQKMLAPLADLAGRVQFALGEPRRLGVAFSGGVDSSAVVCAMRHIEPALAQRLIGITA